ncbi:MAG: hypothetical protein DRP38_00385 [Thermotogae bacterium]|nr:MAG: hypothetical protein DRP38_00385 [Thermotogota bacterium]
MRKCAVLFFVALFGTIILCFEFNVDADIMFTLSSSPNMGRFYSINGEFIFFELEDISMGVGGGINFFMKDFLGERFCFDVYGMSSYIIPLEEENTVLKLSGSGGMSFLGKDSENKGYFVRMEFDIFRRLRKFLIGLGGGLDQHGFEDSYLFSFFIKMNMGFGE